MTTRVFRTGPGPFAGFLFACVLCFGLHSQAAGGPASASGGDAAGPAASGEESAVLLDAGGDAVRLDDAAEVPTVFLLLRVVLVLALVCAGIYGVIWLLKKTSRANAARDPYLRSLAQLPLSQNASARVVSVGSQAFLVGVTDHSVSLIAEITDRELVDAMNLEAERTAGEPVGPFEGVLARFLPGFGQSGAGGRATSATSPGGRASPAAGGADATGADSAASITADFIKRQRERIANARAGGEPPNGGAE